MQTYLTIGTNQILADLHQPIKNGQTKPTGGLWATLHNDNYPHYNPWIEFISIHPHILFYKNPHGNPFLLPASLITLKNNANIFILKSSNQLEFLKKYYPTNDGWIDFEKLSQDFDGIFIDISSIYNNAKQEDKCKIAEFAVSTLIIFDLNCIEHYQKAKVDIEPFDYEFEKEFTNYTIVIEKEVQKITDSSSEIGSLITQIKSQELESLPVSEIVIEQKYDDLLTRFAEEFKNRNCCIETTDTLKHLLARRISRSI